MRVEATHFRLRMQPCINFQRAEKYPSPLFPQAYRGFDSQRQMRVESVLPTSHFESPPMICL